MQIPSTPFGVLAAVRMHVMLYGIARCVIPCTELHVRGSLES